MWNKHLKKNDLDASFKQTEHTWNDPRSIWMLIKSLNVNVMNEALQCPAQLLSLQCHLFVGFAQIKQLKKNWISPALSFEELNQRLDQSEENVFHLS